jgi:hypothetical protein
MTEEEEKILINKGKLLFIGIQLISENGEDIASSSLVSDYNKMKLTNLTNQCKRLTESLWKNFNNDEDLEFNNLIKLIEDNL